MQLINYAKNCMVFGYFGCTWFLGTLATNCPEDSANFGNWRTTVGPDTYCWGGTYVSVGAETKNPELAAYFAYEMCCDPDVMYTLAEETGDFVNNNVCFYVSWHYFLFIF